MRVTAASHHSLKILIIGFGSIGKRRYRNLRSLGVPSEQLAIVDPKSQGLDEFPSVRTYNRLSQAPLEEFDIAFICTPTHLHIEPALAAARAGLYLFIEKPLSHNVTGVKELIALAKRKHLITMVGCNMRFHPSLQYIKKYIEGGKLGKIYRTSLEMGYYLPYWQPDRDYRKSFRAKKETGGGIILDDVHEFDLLFWLNEFSLVKEARWVYGRTSDLEINTEDMALATFKFKNGVFGSVFCDFLQQPYSRGVKIVGEKGNLEWSFMENIVWLKAKDKKTKLYEQKKYDYNKMYIEELKHFLDAVKNKRQTTNSCAQAAGTLMQIINKCPVTANKKLANKNY